LSDQLGYMWPERKGVTMSHDSTAMDTKQYRQQRCPHGWVDDRQCKACATESERDALRAALRDLVRIYKREGAAVTSASEVEAAWLAADRALRA
jgi:hypothetical protein